MKVNLSVLTVGVLTFLSVLLYFSCGKNTGTNNFDVNENLPLSLPVNIEAETEQAAESMMEEINKTEADNEIKTISDINDWEKIGLDRNDTRYDFLEAFLEGDSAGLEKICGVAKGVYDSYKTIKISGYTIQKQPSESDDAGEVVINMTITESDVDAGLTPGTYSYIAESGMTTSFRPVEPETNNFLPSQEVLRKWFLLGYYELHRDFSDAEFLKQYSQAVFDFMQMEINKDYPSPDKNGWTLEAVKQAAKEYFYMDEFDASYIPKENGIYSIGGHGGMSRRYDFIGEPEIDRDDTKLTVQFYADPSKTVKSHTIVYTLKLKDNIYRFVNSEIIYESPFKPYGYSV